MATRTSIVAATTLSTLARAVTSPPASPKLPSAFASPTASCTTAVPGKHGHVPADACNSNWNYDPSFSAAVAFTVLFGLTTLFHIYLAFAFRKAFSWVLIMGCAWEAASFATRAIGALNQQSLAEAIVSQLLLLLAPLWINAFAYMTLGRLIYYLMPSHKVGLKGQSVTKYFVWADILGFIVQGAGGSMISPGSSIQTQQNGLHIYMGGIGLQEFFILIFSVLVVTLHRRVLAMERDGTLRKDAERWRSTLYALYAVLILITVRIIFRLIEFSAGFTSSNKISTHEAYMYALDAMPMFIASFVLCFYHPGRLLQGPDSSFPKLSRKEKKQLKREKKEQKRAKKEEKKEEKRMKKKGIYPLSENSNTYQLDPVEQGVTYSTHS